MNYFTFALIFVSVLFSSAAQLMLKAGMSDGGVRLAMRSGGGLALITTLIRSYWIVGGLGVYVLGAAIWMFVLSKAPVSQAYPCAALAFLFTMAGGFVFLGEPVSWLRVAGVAIILLGVAVVAKS